MPKPYFLTEYIFSSNYHLPETEAVSFAEHFLSNRLSDLLKNGITGKQSVEQVGIPFSEKCQDMGCPCDFVTYHYHFLITLDKKFKDKLNANKAYILKLLNNKAFISDFQKQNLIANEQALRTTSEEYPHEKSSVDFYDIMDDHKISHQYEYIIEALFHSPPDEIISDLENFVISNTTYQNYYGQLIYMVSYEDSLSPEFSHSQIKAVYDELTTKQDIKDGLATISYFQNKYLSGHQRKPKFAVDKYAQLMKLDHEQPHLTDLEKADIILNASMDLATGKLPTVLEDKRKIALVRTMRLRYKKYLEK